MVKRIAALLAAGAGLNVAQAAPTPPADKPSGEAVNAQTSDSHGTRLHARPRLIEEKKGVTPGEVGHLAITFDIDPHWHLYWHGFNVSGMEPQINLTLPAGWEAQPVQWPAPKRDVLEGGILNHIYEERITLIIPVKVPKDAEPASEHEVKASVAWLVCADACIREEAELSLAVKVACCASEKNDSKDATLFAEARERLPRAWPKEGVKGITVKHSARSLEVQAPGAKAVRFFPGYACIPATDPIEDGEAEGDSLSVRFDAPKPAITTTELPPAIRGVIEIDRGPGVKPSWYSVEFPSGARSRIGDW